MNSEDNYLIRIIDQTTGECKSYYNCLTKEQFNKICELLQIKNEDWE